MSRITLNSEETLASAFNDFIIFKTSQGVTDSTIKCYHSHLQCLSKYLDITARVSDLKRDDIQSMISSMRDKGLAQNSIASYIRILKAFISWAREEGLTNITIPSYKTEETIKEVYTDEELKRLLKKPNMKKSTFGEYRTWVIINFILNSGARASTIRNILIGDVDLKNGIVMYRHNKNHKVQVIPLCSQMVSILTEYLRYRKGSEEDYLFCNEEGGLLNADGLRSSIVRYNKKRGVRKTSIHLFRHTFAKKYLIDCGGDAFMLQRLLGHSTLDMTKHYCNIYDVDLVKNYDAFSPLQKLHSNEKHITLKRD